MNMPHNIELSGFSLFRISYSYPSVFEVQISSELKYIFTHLEIYWSRCASDAK